MVLIEGEAETISAEYRAGMDQYALSQSNPANQGDTRSQARACTNLAIRTDESVCADHRCIPDNRVGLDHAMRADRGGGRHARARRNDSGRMDAPGCVGMTLEQRRDPRKREVRIRRNQQTRTRNGGGIEIGCANNHGGGACRRQLPAIARIGEEAELALAGMGKRADAIDLARPITTQLKAESGGDVAESDWLGQGFPPGLPSLPFRRSSTWSVTSMRWLAYTTGLGTIRSMFCSRANSTTALLISRQLRSSS